MKGSREVLEMEEKGEIVFNENTQCYEPVDWQEQQRQDREEMKNDAIYEEERERRAGLHDLDWKNQYVLFWTPPE